ncbi:MAG: hypothetical protein K6A32_06945 [Bacteroidales bacterium]|nr:hypothetical protein [Bacteroidales bacterium]
MKKNLLLLAMLAFAGFGFTACSDDDDNDDNVEVEYTVPTYAEDAIKFELTDEVVLPFTDERTLTAEKFKLKEIELTENGNYFLKLEEFETRASYGGIRYRFGMYNKLKEKFFELLSFAKLSWAKNTDGSITLTITLPDGTIITCNAVITASGTTITDISTANLCRTWNVKSTRVEVEGSNGYYEEPGCNLNEIVTFVKERANITDDFETNQVVTDVVFTRNGTFSIVYANDNIDRGTWRWSNMSDGELVYKWESTEMGLSFANGKAEVKYGTTECLLELEGTTNTGKDVDVVLTMVAK